MSCARRDLTVAGRVVVATGENKFEHRLVRLTRFVPRLCADPDNDPLLGAGLRCGMCV